jgi:hypothetical protein
MINTQFTQGLPICLNASPFACASTLVSVRYNCACGNSKEANGVHQLVTVAAGPVACKAPLKNQEKITIIKEKSNKQETSQPSPGDQKKTSNAERCRGTHDQRFSRSDRR